jgi:hypothetical protein
VSFTIITGKELASAPRSLFLARIVAVDGDTVFLTTAAALGVSSITYSGHNYLCRLKAHEIEAIVAMSAQGFDIPGSCRLTIADDDYFLWTNHIKPHGWKGAILTVVHVLYDVPTNAYSTDSSTWDFILDNPEPPSSGTITVGSVTRMNTARLKVPNVPDQLRCSWVFPQNATQRVLGKDDEASIYYQCGYSPDLAGGVGNFESGTTPYTKCDYTRQGCIARGMFSVDSLSRPTARFSGNTWRAPEKYSGKQYTSGSKIFGFNTPNAPGGRFYPLLYGTQWVDAVVLSPAAEPNSLRTECIVCVAPHGPITAIFRVVVNGVEVAYSSRDPLFTWRYGGGANNSTAGAGGRIGAINVDVIYDGQGDPHGSLCCIEIVVPSQLLANGVPNVRVLAAGPPIATFATGSLARSFAYSANPVWHLVDLLTWGNITYSDLDLQTFCDAADFCDAQVSYLDRNGNTQTHERYRSSFVLDTRNRQILANAILGIRNCAGLMLGINPNTGKIRCFVKQTLADQQPGTVTGSNYNTAVVSKHADGTAGNGYLAYLFDAGSIEKGTFKLTTRSMNDTPNRVSAQFQDENNDWQTDSISTIDPDAYVASGNQEIDVPLNIIGPPNFDQFTRRSNMELSEALRGNPRDDAGGTLYPEFSSTVKASHLASRLGLICGLTWEQLGL